MPPRPPSRFAQVLPLVVVFVLFLLLVVAVAVAVAVAVTVAALGYMQGMVIVFRKRTGSPNTELSLQAASILLLYGR